MLPKKIIIALAVLALIIAGVVFYFIFSGQFLKNVFPGSSQEKEVPRVTPEEQAVELKKEYPGTFTGTINFSDTKDSYKTTLKTDNGKEYIMWPPQSQIIYESFGAENGKRVEVQGRVTKDGNLEWTAIKSVTEK